MPVPCAGGILGDLSSRGAAFGDYNNDGGIDVLILNMNDPPSLLRNDGGNAQNWIKLKLIGTRCNRTAIGARPRGHRHSCANRRSPQRLQRQMLATTLLNPNQGASSLNSKGLTQGQNANPRAVIQSSSAIAGS